MDLMQLQYFKIIAETESLTRAAKILHVSQPAMSAMLKKLEEELGVELFDRSPNRIHLNRTAPRKRDPMPPAGNPGRSPQKKMLCR